MLVAIGASIAAAMLCLVFGAATLIGLDPTEQRGTARPAMTAARGT
jgi:hypothetical protein